jgi:hypothetical protein
MKKPHAPSHVTFEGRGRTFRCVCKVAQHNVQSLQRVEETAIAVVTMHMVM